jgi:hypothetical protein
MNNLSIGFELLLGHAAFKLWPDLPRDMQEKLFEALFPTILSCDIASPYFFMTIIQELRTRLSRLTRSETH